MRKRIDRLSNLGPLLASVLLLLVSGVASGQSQPGPGLGGLPSDAFDNDVERAAAAANQAAFDLLDEECNPGGVLDQIPDPTAPPNPAICGGDVFAIYLTVRELVHTANDLLGAGPTAASLQVDQRTLGTVLRWTAAEELAAQGSAATEFANSQLSNLATRLNALRFGATGFTVAGMFKTDDYGRVVAGAPLAHRGGASADAAETYSPWGGFLNGSFGSGDKVDTGLENAFDFDGNEITLGVDYRFDNNYVVGGMLGYKDQSIDFDETASLIRVVGGGIEVDGTSLIVFGLYQGERFFASASLGTEKLDYEVDRRINYGNNNPNILAADSTARSSPDADVITATFNAAYAFSSGRWGFEPYLNLEYLDIDIDAFTEDRSRTLAGQIDPDAFSLQVAAQSFDSLDATLGFKVQRTFTPELGVVVPFLNVELHKELVQDSRTIFSSYGALDEYPGAGSGVLEFAIPTDEVDDSYVTWALGLSTVLRGGRQREMGGPVGGGLSAFLQFESVEGLAHYDQHIVSVGFRYEF